MTMESECYKNISLKIPLICLVQIWLNFGPYLLTLIQISINLNRGWSESAPYCDQLWHCYTSMSTCLQFGNQLSQIATMRSDKSGFLPYHWEVHFDSDVSFYLDTNLAKFLPFFKVPPRQ